MINFMHTRTLQADDIFYHRLHLPINGYSTILKLTDTAFNLCQLYPTFPDFAVSFVDIFPYFIKRCFHSLIDKFHLEWQLFFVCYDLISQLCQLFDSLVGMRFLYTSIKNGDKTLP